MELMLRHERDLDGLVSLWVDQPEKPVVVLDSWLLGQIELFLDWVDGDEPPTGFILHSTSDRVFIAGADLGEIGGLDDEGLDNYLAKGQEIFNRIENLPCPSVACISGDTLGGGLEISLACKYRIAAEPTKRQYQIGLPEAKLGILPGWGGTQRLAAVMCPSVALGRTTTGRTFNPGQALRQGLVDKIVPLADLHNEAVQLIREGPLPDRPRTIQQRRDEVLAALQWAGETKNRPVRQLPAVDRVIGCMQVGLASGLDAGLKEERKALIDLRATDESKGMLGAFFARGTVLKGIMKKLQEPAGPVEPIAIMGESDMAEMLAKKLGRKLKLERIGSDATSSDAQVFIAATGTNRVDEMAALRAISSIANEDALIVSTLATLSISEIAENVVNPKRLVGIAPVRPLGNPACQLIRGPETSDAAMGSACGLVKTLGLIPILQVNGGPSLLGRLFGAIVQRAMTLAKTCGDPGLVDRLAREEGVTAGPFEVLDKVGLSVARELLEGDDPFGGVDRVYEDRASRTVSPAFAALCGKDQLDLDSARGFWVDSLVEAGKKTIQDEIVDSAEALWVAATFGLGLGPWRRDWLKRID
jgi:3-hydroxyacyl-CoA dehydrogenase/enoyl-CoA hydratase/3-hydroxybutyryl-CoA epimerase